MSLLGIALGEITLGLYMMSSSVSSSEAEAYNWIPIASLSFSVFLASFAVTAIPLTVTAEIMPNKLKEIGVAFCVAMLSIFAFVVVGCMPVIADSIGFGGCLFIFATFCLVGTVFVILYLPETKGKSYGEIMNLMR